MRKFVMTTFVFSLCAMPLTGCEVDEECVEGDEDCEVESDATDPTPDPTTDPTDTTDPVTEFTYHGVVVEDGNVDDAGQLVNSCTSPNTQAEGFDLDAVELTDGVEGTVVGYADVVVAGPGIPGDTGCGYDNGADDVSEAKGAPDGDKDNGYVALNASRVGVEFSPNSPMIKAGDIVKVYETACDVCKDEPYTVGLVKDAACVNDLADAACGTVILGSGNGTAVFTAGW